MHKQLKIVIATAVGFLIGISLNGVYAGGTMTTTANPFTVTTVIQRINVDELISNMELEVELTEEELLHLLLDGLTEEELDDTKLLTDDLISDEENTHDVVTQIDEDAPSELILDEAVPTPTVTETQISDNVTEVNETVSLNGQDL